MDDFIFSKKSENTVKNTNYDWKKIETFCKEQNNGSLNVKNVPADALDKLLGNFFKNVRKQNGGEYEPDSLSSFQRSFQGRLKELKLSFNILKRTKSFVVPEKYWPPKEKIHVKQGRGNKLNACRELTSEEEEKLFESDAFGCHNPGSAPAHIMVVLFTPLWIQSQGRKPENFRLGQFGAALN